MWIRPPCGSLFRGNANHRDAGPDPAKQRGAFVRCGSRYFRPAKGQTRLNCSCVPTAPQKPKHFADHRSEHNGACGEHLSVDSLGGVSASYRRLPMPAGANPAVMCCRHRQTSKGPITANTLNVTKRDFATLRSETLPHGQLPVRRCATRSRRGAAASLHTASVSRCASYAPHVSPKLHWETTHSPRSNGPPRTQLRCTRACWLEVLVRTCSSHRNACCFLSALRRVIQIVYTTVL